MKAILRFNLPEEQIEHRDALDGSKWKAVVWELYEEILRPIWKYGNDEQAAAFAEDIWKQVLDRLSARSLCIDD